MRSERVALALILMLGATSGVQARAAPASSVLPRPHLAIQPAGVVQPVYWAWRGGVRVWVDGPYPAPYYGPHPYYPPAYAPPAYVAPPPYYGRAPYWWNGQGYWHRRWYGGGWHYW